VATATSTDAETRGHRECMRERLQARAREQGVDPEIVAHIPTTMIDAFIELERHVHRSRERAQSPAP
jgi:hypothetical protein